MTKSKYYLLIIYLSFLILLSACVSFISPNYNYNKTRYKYIINSQSIWRMEITRFNKVKFVGILQIYIKNDRLTAILYDPLGIMLEKIIITSKKIDSYIYYNKLKSSILPYILRNTLLDFIKLSKISFTILKQQNFTIKKYILFLPIKKITIKVKNNLLHKITINWPLLFLKIKLIHME